LKHLEDRRDFPGIFVNNGFTGVRDYPDDIFINAAPGDMDKAMDGQIS